MYPDDELSSVVLLYKKNGQLRLPIPAKTFADIETELERNPDAMADVIEKMEGNKKRILDAVPNKGEPRMNQKQVLAKAKLRWSDWNSKKLDELVKDGEISKTSEGYQKTN